MARQLDYVDDTVLVEDDFQDVKAAVSQLAGVWQGFGSMLGLAPSAIREIQLAQPDPSRCLDEVLERWLKEDYNRKKFPPPSWRQLVSATQNSSGGRNPALAKKIASQHPTTQNSSGGRNPALAKKITSQHPKKEKAGSCEVQPISSELPPQLPPRPTQEEQHKNSQIAQQSTIQPPQDESGSSSVHIYDSPHSPGVQQITNGDVPVSQPTQETAPVLHSHCIDQDMYSSIGASCSLETQLSTTDETMDMETGGGHYEVIKEVKEQNSVHLSGSNPRIPVNRSLFPHYDKKKGQIDMDGPGKVAFDYYAPYKPESMSEIKLTFGIFAPLTKQPDLNFEKYDMANFPHGIALIINNEEFLRQKIREGTHLDEENLVQTFRYLGYQVEVHRDKNKAEIEAIFDDMKTRDHSKYDSFVCCLLTHGTDGGFIYSSDSEKLELNNLISKLNAANCKSLFGKPKLFFIQACRGKGKSPAVYIDDNRVESDSDTPLVLPNETDFFFGYATTPTMVAWRDLDNGSWYVNELCQVLCEHSLYADLTSMHEIVQRKIAEQYEINDFKQTTENNNRLTKKVYFFNTYSAK